MTFISNALDYQQGIFEGRSKKTAGNVFMKAIESIVHFQQTFFS